MPDMSHLDYPKGEIRWVSHYDQTGNLRYLVTSKPTRDRYFLYEQIDGKFIRLGSGPDPKKLEDRYIKDLYRFNQAPVEAPELEDEELEL